MKNVITDINLFNLKENLEEGLSFNIYKSIKKGDYPKKNYNFINIKKIEMNKVYVIINDNDSEEIIIKIKTDKGNIECFCSYSLNSNNCDIKIKIDNETVYDINKNCDDLYKELEDRIIKEFKKHILKSWKIKQ
jgi:predicted transcriptional regulator